MPDGLPTPRSTLRTGYRLLVWCKACRRQEDAELAALVEAGRGDEPLRDLRFRCSNCGSRLTDFVLTGGADVPALVTGTAAPGEERRPVASTFSH